MAERFIGPLPKCMVRGCKNPVRRHYEGRLGGPNRKCNGHIQRAYAYKKGYTKLPPDGRLLKACRPLVMECRWCGGQRDLKMKAPFCSRKCLQAKKTAWNRENRERERLFRELDEIRDTGRDRQGVMR